MHARRVPAVGAVAWEDLVRCFSGSATEVRDLVDYCRVFSAEDVVRWALAAYRAAVVTLRSPEGAWVEEGLPWSSPHGFAEEFVHEMKRRVWDSCARSARYVEVEAWRDRMRDSETGEARLKARGLAMALARDVAADFLGVERSQVRVFVAAQEHELPLCGNVSEATNAGGAA